jgi:hypothetical protein
MSLLRQILCKQRFHAVYQQYSEHFSQYYGVLLFVFGIMSVALNAMQVKLAVDALEDHRLENVWVACRFFSVLVFSLILSLALCLMVLLLWLVLDECIFAIRDRTRQRGSHIVKTMG